MDCMCLSAHNISTGFDILLMLEHSQRQRINAVCCVFHSTSCASCCQLFKNLFKFAVIQCPELEVDYSWKNSTLRDANTFINIQCYPGYYLTTDDNYANTATTLTVQCNTTGQWTPTIPQCRRLQQFILIYFTKLSFVHGTAVVSDILHKMQKNHPLFDNLE